MELTTSELLDHVKVRAGHGENVEATIVKGGLRATHFLEYWEGRFYDTGIDDQRSRTSRRSLLEHYPRTIWTVM
jgi:hypothetical protein